jgi:hypothetical protein
MDKINKIRERLGAMYEKTISCSDTDTLKVSQTLDKLIVNCLKCKLNAVTLESLNCSDHLGTHSCFYYWGIEHLLINLTNYINCANKNKEKVFIFLDPEIFETLLERLKLEKISIDTIVKFSVLDLISLYQTSGAGALKSQIHMYEKEIIDAGYSGFRMIGQPSYVLSSASKHEFLSLESALSKTFNGTLASALCVYDFNDFMNEKKYITDEIIQESVKSHSNIYLLEDFQKITTQTLII